MVSRAITLPRIQSVLAGYVDTAGFLALQGLFTAHVTGNFVTLGAALVHGSSGILAKLLALPVFCVVIVVTRIASFHLPRLGLPILPSMLALKTLLLAAGAVLAITLGPFCDANTAGAVVTGLVLVSAMAIQNAAHRVHYATAPPTTLMTGTTTQVMIDLADLMRRAEPEVQEAARGRLARMVPSVLAFAAGCAGGAALFATAGMWCFVIPPLLALVSLTPPILRTVES